MSRFLSGEALKRETFKQLVYITQRSSKKRNARRRKRMKQNLYGGGKSLGRNKINRTGEQRLNNFGSRMAIKEYRNNSDIDVYFP